MEVDQSIDSNDVDNTIAHKIFTEITSELITISDAMPTLPPNASDMGSSVTAFITPFNKVFTIYSSIITKCEVIMSNYTRSPHWSQARLIHEIITAEYDKLREFYDNMMCHIVDTNTKNNLIDCGKFKELYI